MYVCNGNHFSYQEIFSFAQQSFTHRDFNIILFALSMATVSNDAR